MSARPFAVISRARHRSVLPLARRQHRRANLRIAGALLLGAWAALLIYLGLGATWWGHALKSFFLYGLGAVLLLTGSAAAVAALLRVVNRKVPRLVKGTVWVGHALVCVLIGLPLWRPF